MRIPLLLIASHALVALGQTDGSSIVLTGSKPLPSSTSNLGGDLLPTGTDATYLSYNTTSTNLESVSDTATDIAAANGTSLTESGSSRPTDSSSASILRGSLANGASPTSSSNNTTNATTTMNSTATETQTSQKPTNTQPCNNHPEYCTRKYSNISFVAAHNSPFVNPNNAAANQLLPVTDQLNDGIRMLQGQTHYNSTTQTISYCHTSCDLLDAGTAETYFRNISRWVRSHPFDVVTLLIGNSDFVDVRNFTGPLTRSGLSRYAYVPSQVPMNISAWPTLGEMILSQKRVVIFMDYKANQTEVPYILDEFSQLWETPFSPQDRNFPCTQQRPPGLSEDQAKERLYMANHNLNTEISLAGTSLLVPSITLINETNAVEGFGSLGAMADNCTAMWDRAPNFLLVDFYNRGNVPGSVFQVAAKYNDVTYSKPCCGRVPSKGALHRTFETWLLILIVVSLSSLS